MLSDNQLARVVAEANQSINIPLVSEGQEGRVIQTIVERINPQLEPALQAVLPAIYVECIKIALREGMSAGDRRKQISDRLIGELGGPLTRELNQRVDSSILPESVEGSVLEQVTAKIIKEFVEWTVGELDEQMAALGA